MPIFTKREEDFVLGQDILPGPFNSLFDGIYTDLNLLAVDFYGSSEPTSTAYGMKWHDTGETPNVIRVYTSGDTDRWLWMGIWIGAEVNRPSYPATGAIWIDSENNYYVHVYTGSAWQATGISAASVVYDNTDSGLTATDVKAAIDEIVTSINTKVNTSDYEDLDVLNKVKTVDGTGSGLDADLLDGQHASHFDDAINTKVNTSDYEDLDVLNKVKTVDGTGSGLDADLLDGVGGDGYATRPTSSTFPVGSVALCVSSSSTNIYNGGTVAGSLLYLMVGDTAANGIYATDDSQSGTWKNISGRTSYSDGVNTGYFVRIA
jgi:hypothetical protein